MFKLIYVILGFYFISILFVVIKDFYLKFKSMGKKSTVKAKTLVNSNLTASEDDDLFILNNKKEKFSFKNNGLAPVVISKNQRHMAFEKAKYKCEECAKITNLDVYNIAFDDSDSSENLKILCKNCSEAYSVNPSKTEPLTE